MRLKAKKMRESKDTSPIESDVETNDQAAQHSNNQESKPVVPTILNYSDDMRSEASRKLQELAELRKARQKKSNTVVIPAEISKK